MAKTTIFGTAILGALLGASAQPSMHTILSNGPVSNRLNIVVLSEGYTTNQLVRFLVDSTNAVNGLLSHQPYQEYRNYVNAFAISVASNQSGSDHPTYPLYRDTYFNSTYDPVSDRLITIPTNITGQGKIDAFLQSFMPKYHLPILLVNDPAYGGSDGFDKTAIASIGDSSFEILTHETGHAGDYGSIVGVFNGAHYHTTNWYRSKLECAMNHFGVPFCEVCSEALVLGIYQRVRPVDAFVPASTNLSISSTQAITFNVSLLQPSTHNLSVQWFTNGIAVTGATNGSFTLFPETLGSGNHAISSVVRDETTLVRTDPNNLLAQIVKWSASVSLPQLQLDSPLMLAGGSFAFWITGNAPQGFVIQGSTNLVDWIPLRTNFLSAGKYGYTNSNAGSFPERYFRAMTPP